MGLRYYKRIGGNKGLGLNVSNSGLSSSYRTRYGTIGSRGFSIRTGIPGWTFRSGYGGGKDKGATLIIVLATLFIGLLVYYSVVILYNVVLFIFWTLTTLITVAIRKYNERKEQKRINNNHSIEIDSE